MGRSILKVSLVGIVASLVVWFYASGAYDRADPEAMRVWIRDAGLWGSVAFVLAYSLLQPFGVNGLIFLLTAPLIWAPAEAFILNWAGSVGCAFVSFFLARFIAHDWVQKRLPKRARRFDERLQTHGLRTVLLLRLIFFTSPIIQYALGASRVGTKPFAIGTLVGLVPFSVLVTLLGVSINAWLDEHPLSTWPWARIGPIVVAVAVAIAALVVYLLRRRRAKSLDLLN